MRKLPARSARSRERAHHVAHVLARERQLTRVARMSCGEFVTDTRAGGPASRVRGY
jgi:hypothetical protein